MEMQNLSRQRKAAFPSIRSLTTRSPTKAVAAEMRGTASVKTLGAEDSQRAVLQVPPLVVEHVTKSYEVGGRIVAGYWRPQPDAPGEEIVSIVGPSGCGRPTLLNTLCGLLTPDSGRIRWHGREVSGQPQKCRLHAAEGLLLPWRTALGNAMLGLEIRGVARAKPRTAATPCSTSLDSTASPITIPLDPLGGMRPARGAGPHQRCRPSVFIDLCAGLPGARSRKQPAAAAECRASATRLTHSTREGRGIVIGEA